jgi:hypothetical protein
MLYCIGGVLKGMEDGRCKMADGRISVKTNEVLNKYETRN